MKANEFLIRPNLNKNIYLIYGSEAYLRDMSVKLLKETLSLEPLAFNYAVVSGNVSQEAAVETCATAPCFSENKLIVFKNISLFKQGEADKLCDFLEHDLQKEVYAVFLLSDKPDKRKKLYKTIEKCGILIEAEPLSGPELTTWIVSTAKKRKAKISKQDASLLLEVAGTDMYTLMHEIDKLACIGGTITEERILQYTARSLEYDVFELHKLMLQNKTKEALALADTVVQEEKSPFGLLALLYTKFKQIYMAKGCLLAKVPKEKAIAQMAQQSGVKPYAAKLALSEAEQFSMTQLTDAIKLLADTDFALKTGRGSMEMGIGLVLLKLYGKI